MVNKEIKNLVVDFGGVLINLDRQRCIDNFKKLNLSDIDELLGLYSQQGFFMDFEKGLISPAEFREHICQLIGEKRTDQQIDDAWNSFLVDIPYYKLDLLLKLREKYVVYLLSNTNQIHWDWACKHAFPHRSFGVEDYFEKIYLSFKMKMAKPDSQIFTTVLEDAGLNPAETFYIDDSVANCQVAQSLGISTYTPLAREDWGHLFK
ncbi:MAG: HAD family phosphatase [Bacteroidaceae bacterium]|nr:HAD family phosphatase [Bacteroidaceae bacterium]